MLFNFSAPKVPRCRFAPRSSRYSSSQRKVKNHLKFAASHIDALIRFVFATLRQRKIKNHLKSATRRVGVGLRFVFATLRRREKLKIILNLLRRTKTHSFALDLYSIVIMNLLKNTCRVDVHGLAKLKYFLTFPSHTL